MILWFYEKYHLFLPYFLPRSGCMLIQALGYEALVNSAFTGSEFLIHSEALTGSPTLKSTDPMKLVHLLLLHQPQPLMVPGDQTGFSGYRFTRLRVGRNQSAVCHPLISLMLI